MQTRICTVRIRYWSTTQQQANGHSEAAANTSLLVLEENPPGYVTWDGQLEAAFKQIDLLMEQLYILSETSAAAFGQLKAGLAESGTALRRLMMAPLAKVNSIH